MKNAWLFIVIFSFFTLDCNTTLKAQNEIGTLISESLQDTEAMTKAFGGPFLRAIGTDFNTGWVNTAEPMVWGQFDIRAVGTASFAPEADLSFKPAAYGLDAAPDGGIYTTAETFPTIFGDPTEEEIRAVSRSEDAEVETTLPIETLGVRGAPMLMPQVNIGLPRGTQLMIRGLPPVDMPSYEELQRLETQYWALGFQHDIKQWIPSLRTNPFSWSVFFAYSNAEMSLGGPFFTFDDLNRITGTDLSEPTPVHDYTKQKLVFDTKGYSMGTVVSKSYSFITIFGGIEYNTAETEVRLEGQYPYVNYNDEVEHLPEDYEGGNKINVFEETGQMGINGGVRFRVWYMSITTSGTYVMDGYSSAAVSVGIGIFE
ncbi:MAG: hypothetical protein K9J27_03160 [Bacteroidales bacterium]|nr:hypothetical protein [Bacteroidales bacterium]